VGNATYGSTEVVREQLADRARAIGADAVIKVALWHQPAGWAWAAPHGAGVAVKIGASENFDFTALPGGWF
jgi:uncharacterized protein YbjQ (UPF0145 family)